MNLKQIDLKEVRNFGIALSVILFIIGTNHLIKARVSLYQWFYAVSLLVLMLSLILTKLLLPVYIIFVKVGHVLGWINTRILLVVIFYVFFTPIGLIKKIFVKDFLNKKIELEKESYWLDKSKTNKDMESYERQY